MAVHEDCDLCYNPMLVIAPTRQEFMDYINHGNRPPYHYQLVTRTDELLGRSGTPFLILGKVSQIPNYAKLYKQALASRLRVVREKHSDPCPPASPHLLTE